MRQGGADVVACCLGLSAHRPACDFPPGAGRPAGGPTEEEELWGALLPAG